jgi:hypothetical protein
MAIKKLPAVPVKKKASPRIARPALAKAPFGAHPRLVHGFLVRLPTRSTIPAKAPKAAVTAVASATTRAQTAPDAKREGPADDATFH